VKNTNHEEIELTFELPDYKKDDIKVIIKNKHLFIKANKEHSQKKEKTDLYHEEHSEHNFNHTTILPKVDSKNMRWFFKNEVLTIKIPKL